MNIYCTHGIRLAAVTVLAQYILSLQQQADKPNVHNKFCWKRYNTKHFLSIKSTLIYFHRINIFFLQAWDFERDVLACSSARASVEGDGAFVWWYRKTISLLETVVIKGAALFSEAIKKSLRQSTCFSQQLSGFLQFSVCMSISSHLECCQTQYL